MSITPWFFVFALFALGIFCLLTRRNLIKLLIGLELMSKGATLALIWSGVLKKMLAYTQSLAVIIIAIEVMVVAVFLALIYAFHEKSGTMDTDELRKLKG